MHYFFVTLQREVDELFEMFDPSDRRRKDKNLEKKKKPAPAGPFKFHDESIEDWVRIISSISVTY